MENELFFGMLMIEEDLQENGEKCFFVTNLKDATVYRTSYALGVIMMWREKYSKSETIKLIEENFKVSAEGAEIAVAEADAIISDFVECS